MNDGRYVIKINNIREGNGKKEGEPTCKRILGECAWKYENEARQRITIAV